VAASYEAGRLIDGLSTAQLPTSARSSSPLGHLKAVMYLGYYSTGTLDESKLRFAIASHLYPAYEILIEQIRRAASYEGFRSAAPREPEWPETVTLALLRKIPALRALLSKDVLAAFQGDPAANSVEEVIFSYPSIEAITTHRIAHELYREGVPCSPHHVGARARGDGHRHPPRRVDRRVVLHRPRHGRRDRRDVRDRARGEDLPGRHPRALSLDRGGSDAGTKRHPTIENNVTIYAGATILGGNTVIGRGSIIGGNAWLVESVPPSSRISYEAPRAR